MRQQAPPIEVDAFFASLRDRSANGVSMIACDGGEMPVSVRMGDPTKLVFSFTGAAANRGNFSLPHFAVHGLAGYTPATIIGFSDPSLARDDALKTAWFSGHEGFPLQRVLPDLIAAMIEHLGAARVAFVGGSSGGFAALFYSWHIPGSVAIVTNPQTNFQRYIQPPIADYRSVCWPSLANNEALAATIDTDLCTLYANRFANSVIYLQVASDYSHLKGQFAPFVASLPPEFIHRLIVRIANWGRRGHKPAPANIWVPWVKAALAAPDTTAASIEQTWEEMNPLPLPPLPPSTRPTNRDAQIAAELAGTATRNILRLRSTG
ncbi:MAG: hypothetical protein E6R14_07805 [Thermomicrobiales bacterium]|nr:MAG: hypothetical protein E6R14_07805 [Thermomicrobiales bacterium]